MGRPPLVLVCVLSLIVGLGVVSGREADSRPQCPTEGPPHLGHKLRTPVRYNVHRDTMEVDHVLHQQLSSLSSGGELWEGDKMDGLGEPVDYGQDDGVTL